MAKLTWDEAVKRIYQTGTDHAVLYPMKSNGTYDKGVAWNGVTSYKERPSGGEAQKKYADNILYAILRGAEEFGATVECFQAPPEFAPCDGLAQPAPGVLIGQQKRQPFGFCCRTRIGNAVDGDDYGYKLHIVWNATVNPGERSYQTVNNNPDNSTFSYEFESTPVAVTGYRNVASMEIDSTLVNATKLASLETALYGSASVEPRLPTPDEVINMLK